MNTTFLWGWNKETPAHDPGMTRAKAGALIRAWRAAARMSVKRIDHGHYKVIFNDTSATVIIIRRYLP